jgi:hypothetical protein
VLDFYSSVSEIERDIGSRHHDTLAQPFACNLGYEAVRSFELTNWFEAIDAYLGSKYQSLWRLNFLWYKTNSM